MKAVDMEKNWRGLDFLRGLGIFVLLILHSAFYYFAGLWDLDLNDPPLIITVIGFFLMFAGLFGIVSGMVHSIGMKRLAGKEGWTPGRILLKKLVSGAFILIVAYLYFNLTGPGLAEFADRRMNNSVLVELIRNGRLVGLNSERLLYVDSLVMIGTNIVLLGIVWAFLMRIRQLKAWILLILSAAVLGLSLFRIPLYSYYLDLVDSGNRIGALLLFPLVNKNNPILPYLAFGLFGSWLGIRLEEGRSRLPAFLIGLPLLAIGLVFYVFLPDTMLQRAIDLKWYSIMIAQLGLFILLILGALAVFDRRSLKKEPVSPLFEFIARFSRGGLSAFFLESVLSALVWRLITAFFPGLELGIAGALLYGSCLALFWGIALMLWEKAGYRGSIESLYAFVLKRLGFGSTKAGKLRRSVPSTGAAD
jgi:hypothetical protein